MAFSHCRQWGKIIVVGQGTRRERESVCVSHFQDSGLVGESLFKWTSG